MVDSAEQVEAELAAVQAGHPVRSGVNPQRPGVEVIDHGVEPHRSVQDARLLLACSVQSALAAIGVGTPDEEQALALVQTR
jgi:hypothetical protein